MKKQTAWGRSLLAVATLALFASGAFAIGARGQTRSSAQGQNESLVQMEQNPNEWVMPSGNYAAWRYSRLNQINASNVGRLQAAWTMSSGTARGFEGQPLVIGDMLYFESPYPNYVYAVDLNHTDRIAWKFEPPEDPNAPPVACCDVVNRGVAYADGMIFANALDGKVYALNAQNGKVIWTATNADPLQGQTITAAPLVIKNIVLVGVSGGEYGVRGYLSAFDIHNGKLLWKAYSEGPDKDILFNPNKTIDSATGRPVGPNSSLKTWRATEWKTGGGTVWGWFSYDPQLDLLYYGTGNPGTWNPSQRPGLNRWAMSIIARHPETGEAAWVYQMTPHDGWDYDGVNEMVLVPVNDHGRQVPALVHFDRNGYAYVLNRANGEIIAVHKYDPSVNWAKGIDPETHEPIVDPTKMTVADKNVKNICPAAQGDKDEQPVSYDPQTRLFYAPLNHLCMDYQAFDVKYKAGFPFVGAIVNMYPGPGGNRGRFIAFDPMTGRTVWEIKDEFQDWSGALTTAGNLAFYGTLTGLFRAVDIRTGKILYEFKCPSGIIGNPIAYAHNGREYIAVFSGVGGWAAIGLAENLKKPTAGLGAVGLTATLANYTNLGGVMMVFALPKEVASAR